MGVSYAWSLVRLFFLIFCWVFARFLEVRISLGIFGVGIVVSFFDFEDGFFIVSFVGFFFRGCF